MKKSLSILSFLACAAVALTGCSKDDAQSAATATKEVTLTLSAEKPEISNSPEARTVYSDGHILWNTTGEKLRITYADNGTIAEGSTFYATNSATVSEDQKTAKFQFQGTVPAEAGAYTLHALYPSSAYASSNKKIESSAISVNIKTPQSPLADSFDPEADVMVGTSVKSYATFPENEDIAMTYKRLVAHGQVTLTGLPFEEGETINNVTFTAPEGTKVAGDIRTDLLKKEISYTTDADNYVSLSYTNATLNAEGNFVAWFCSIPFTVEADQAFKIEVTTTRGTYMREITARAEGISFKENTRNLLSVNMASADFTPVAGIELADGSYVIAVKVGETYHAMLATANGTSSSASKRRGTQSIEYKNPYQTNDDALVWTVTKTGANIYTIENGGSYLNNAVNDASAPLSTSPVDLVLKQNEDGTTYRITSSKDTNRDLGRNNDSGFAFYATSGSYPSDLYFIPAEIKAVPVITVAEKTLTLASDDETIHTIGVELKNATAEDIVCVAYEGEKGETAATWFTAEFKTDEAGNGIVELLAEANTAEEARKGRVVLTATTAEGTATETISIEQQAYNPNADKGGTDEYVFADMGYSDSADVTEVKGAGTTLTFAKGTNSTNSPKYYTSDKTARMYSGNTLTISSNNQLPIIKIEFVGSTLNALTSDVVTYTSSTGTWTGSAQSVCFTATGKPRFTSIKVTYGEDGGNTPDPTLPKLDTPKVTATVDNTVNNKVTVVWGPITNADSYTVSFSPETIEKATVSASEVGSDGFFTKDYTGLAYNTDYTISVVANPEANADFQPSAAGTATVKTGEDPSPKITGITWNFDGETITSNSPIIGFPIEGGAVEVNVATLNQGEHTIAYSPLSQFEIDADDTYFMLSAGDNTEGEPKEETLTLTLGDSTFEITIKQAGRSVQNPATVIYKLNPTDKIATNTGYKAWGPTTINNISWTLTCGQYSSSLWLGTNSNSKSKCVLGTTYENIGTPINYNSTTPCVSALIANTDMSNVEKIIVKNTSIAGSAKTLDVSLVYSTDNGVTYTLIETKPDITSGSTQEFTFTAIPKARYAIVVKGTTDFTFRGPTIEFYAR